MIVFYIVVYSRACEYVDKEKKLAGGGSCGATVAIEQ
jgi:hypothetical protein